jgi:hypothetical protein
MKLLQSFLCASLLCASLGATALLAGTAAHAAPVPAAIFDFELYDISLQGSMQGESAADAARLRMIDALLRQDLEKAGYRPVGTAPVRADVQRQDMRSCDGCEAGFARRLGADVSVFGWVQKVSNLILNINLVIRDAGTGKVLRAGSVDIRGDTDESWRRGLQYLLDERILPHGKAALQ